MTEKLQARTAELVRERTESGKTFLGADKLLLVKAGTPAKNPKVSTRWSFRPRFHCSCPTTKAAYLKWYYAMIDDFIDASYCYRNEPDEEADFPPGMYKPPNFTLNFQITAADLR